VSSGGWFQPPFLFLMSIKSRGCGWEQILVGEAFQTAGTGWAGLIGRRTILAESVAIQFGLELAVNWVSITAPKAGKVNSV
jgi:hypothetical protein